MNKNNTNFRFKYIIIILVSLTAYIYAETPTITYEESTHVSSTKETYVIHEYQIPNFEKWTQQVNNFIKYEKKLQQAATKYSIQYSIFNKPTNPKSITSKNILNQLIDLKILTQKGYLEGINLNDQIKLRASINQAFLNLEKIILTQINLPIKNKAAEKDLKIELINMIKSLSIEETITKEITRYKYTKHTQKKSNNENNSGSVINAFIGLLDIFSKGTREIYDKDIVVTSLPKFFTSTVKKNQTYYSDLIKQIKSHNHVDNEHKIGMKFNHDVYNSDLSIVPAINLQFGEIDSDFFNTRSINGLHLNYESINLQNYNLNAGYAAYYFGEKKATTQMLYYLGLLFANESQIHTTTTWLIGLKLKNNMFFMDTNISGMDSTYISLNLGVHFPLFKINKQTSSYLELGLKGGFSFNEKLNHGIIYAGTGISF